jgi:hypothetical protein
MKDSAEEKSSIYRERDLLVSLSSSALFMLCQATTLGDTVINNLAESVSVYSTQRLETYR